MGGLTMNFTSGFRSAASVLLALVAVSVVPRAEAQVLYGNLLGTVTDQSGGVVPNATVTVTNVGTSQVREVTTNESGFYQFQTLQAGVYDLNITAGGFSAHTQEGITISINTVQRVDVSLQLGQVTETIRVTADALTLQTDKADVHVELEKRQLGDLPLQRYRNYQTLINLVPGAVPGRFQNANTDTPARALTTNINGTNRNNNNTRFDGATSINIFLPHHTIYVPPAETIETVNISTNNFDAESGMAGGAAINVTTKSGTNEFHGVFQALHENAETQANDFFFVGETPKNIVNIDTVTGGGPVVKDKLFFFGAWEGNRERVSRFSRRGTPTVPTADQRAGDFSRFNTTIFDPLTGDPDGRNRTAFANNMVPMSRQSRPARIMQDLIPLPNLLGDSDNFFNQGVQKANRDNFDTKWNWNVNDRISVFGKYGIMDAQVTGSPALGPAGGPCMCDGGNGTGDTVAQIATVGHTWVFSPNFLWDATFGWGRQGQEVLGPDFGTNFGLDVLGIPGTNGPDIRQSGMPIFNISGFTRLGNRNNWSPIFRNDQSFTLSTNFSLIKGAHDLRFGFDGIRHHLNHWQPEIGAGPRGLFNFSRNLTSTPGGTAINANAWAGFLLGGPNTLGKSIQFEKMTAFETQVALYIRDRWRITPKLTATLGVRYERYPLMTRAGRGGIESFDEQTNELVLGGIGGNPKDLDVSISSKLFAPRLGLAYRLNDSSVIRSGYGITFNPMVLARPLRGFFPLTIAANFESANSFTPFNTLDEGIPEIALPDISSGRIPMPGTVTQRFITQGDLKRGYIQSWNFIIERKLPYEFITSIGYVGTQTVRSFSDIDINYALIGTGSAGRMLNRKFAATGGRTASTLAWNGRQSSNYHSLQIAINRRAADGLTIKSAYTYSKAINIHDDDGWTGLPETNIPEFFDRNRARAGFDHTNIFQFSFVYDLPFGPGQAFAQSGAARWLLGDWQINGIFSAIDGRPFTVRASGGSLNAPGSRQTADLVKAEVKRGADTVQEFFDTSAFAPVTEARFGTSTRNILRGPRTTNLDLSLFRDIPISEGMTLQVRAEAFNIANNPHFANPNSNVNSSAFGRINRTNLNAPNRTIRFGLRLQY